jgi:demethylmenaquinone methyltransferase/2-methoxy-6-polyprenyl-1,4-benzoquinol methylase
MFGRNVRRYDLVNRVMTLGLDRRWRAMAAAEAGLADGGAVLDVCCGTGDLSFALGDANPGSRVVGLDFSRAMLQRAREKAADRRSAACASVAFVEGDLLRLPFADSEFDAVTVAWGLRNVPDLGGALAEMVRVTKPGGRVVSLDMTPVPRGLAGRLHTAWLGGVVPLLGRLISGDADAYRYLPASVALFPPAAELAATMARAGLDVVRYRLLALGGVAIHVGELSPSPR